MRVVRVLLVGQLQMRRRSVQIPQNVIPIVDRGQVFGRVPIDVQRKKVDAEFDQEIDAVHVTFGGGQMESGVAVQVRFVGVATACV